MAGEKIKYTCKNCGWSTSIREEWSDLKPQRCMNRKCNTSFVKQKDALEIKLPEVAVVEQAAEPKYVAKKKGNKNEPQDD